MSEERLPGLVYLTPVNPAFNDDLHALLNVLRDKCPVHRDDDQQHSVAGAPFYPVRRRRLTFARN